MQQGKRLQLIALTMLFWLPMAASAADTPSGKARSYGAAAQARSAERNGEPRYSRKCGIYSGICPIVTPMKVGDYCVCVTPSGPIHGVVVP
jgi:hypothetical protein